jgi:membrane protein
VANTASPWELGGLTWWQLLRRVWVRFWEDQLPGRCAELAYYFLFSVFPLLLFLTTLLGYLAGPDTRLRIILFHWLDRLAPSPDVTRLLTVTLDQITRDHGGARLSLSLLVAVWVASTGMLAVARTLNKACALEETRPWWKRRLVAVGLTIGFAVLIICALAAILYGHLVSAELGDSVGFGPLFVSLWHLARWPLVLLFVLLAFEVIYNYAPVTGASARRSWGTPGAVVGVSVWLAASFGLRVYLEVEELPGKSMTYGSLGAVIVLLLWFYLTAFAILVGGEVNSEIARRAAPRNGGSPGPRRRSARRRPAARG